MNLLRWTAGVLALSACGPAAAQVDLRSLQARDVILQQQDIDRQTALYARIEAQAARDRADTVLTLRALQEPPSGEPVSLRPSLPAPERRGELPPDYDRIGAAGDAWLAADAPSLRPLGPDPKH